MCIATATRAEYGLLRWLMQEIQQDPDLDLQCIATGAHLSSTHGFTYKEIEKDGFPIDAKVEMLLSSDGGVAITKSMALCTIGVGEALARLCPDILVVLGDRYELLAICSAATVMNVPIAHVSGGDLTEGAIDNQVRHAVTKLSHLHFPGTEQSGARLIQMGEDPVRVFVVGEPGLDSMVRSRPTPRAAIAVDLGLDAEARWVMFAYHPETLGAGRDVERVRATLDALAELPNLQVVMTHPNADAGGLEIARALAERSAADPARFRLFKSLGHDRFISFLREAWAIVGNSSAGIVEAPLLRLASLNIGTRQQGRLMPANVVSAEGSSDSIRAALRRLDEPSFRNGLGACENPYGDGNASARIKDVLKNVTLAGLLQKPFHAPDRR